ncbi:MAG: hypothetical protein A2138_23330 [Deltaproteobacteria bacterium RBG_16_71_12]|nr:MAG: hypothetical protein A2138_23330 [Deltaproteobacteria bacterium RBG_16_71_12]
MDGTPHQIAARLLTTEPPVSRNRHFASFQDPATRRGYALYRRLRALVAELDAAERAGTTVVVERRTRSGRVIMRLVWDGARARRAAWLELPAWEALLTHPTAARVLGAGAPAGTRDQKKSA